MKRDLLWSGVALAAACLAVLLLSGPASALSTGNGGWQWQNPLPEGNGYTGGHFLDARHGWLIDDGDIFHTSNGGLTLTVQAHHRVSFKAITFVDAKHGWAVGYPADARTGRVVVYRTTNGGRNWVRVLLRRIGGIDSVSFANRKVGWAISGDAVLHTVDGGLHWDIQVTRKYGRFHCVQALSTRRAWVSGALDTLLRTVNGGVTWKRLHTGTGSRRNLTGMRFTSPNNGWVSGGGEIIHTSDGGAHWASQFSIRPTVIGLTFADSQNGWATCGAVYHTTDGGADWVRQATASFATWGFALTPSDAVVGFGMVYNPSLSHTSDGGVTWQSSISAADGYFGTLNALQFCNTINGWAVGSAGEILKTADGGVTWSPQVSGTTQDLNDAHFLNASDGWIVGDQGVIVRTTDGGATWTPQTSGVTDDLSGVTFVDAQHGWVVGGTINETGPFGTGVILNTTDGGTDWTQQATPVPDAVLNDVVFADARHGWAVGEVLGDTGTNVTVILATRNGGATWAKQLTYSPPMTGNTSDGELRAIACIDAKHLVAVGYDDSACEIFRTANAGKTWIRFVTPASWKVYPGRMDARLALCDVVFADAKHGWAVGDGTVIRTTNGGVSWTEQPVGTDQVLGAVSFVSPTHGWVAGQDADILTTTTGGNAR